MTVQFNGVREFEKALPDAARYLKKQIGEQIYNDIRDDDNYIVRVGDGFIEFGYASDDWKVK